MWVDGVGDNLVRGENVNQAEAALMHGLIDRRRFIRTVLGAGVSAVAAAAMADKAIAIQINQANRLAGLRDRYDYIVCGAGSAGCVVARRLAENPDVSVLLVEAGGAYDGETVTDPLLWQTNFGSPRDWGFAALPGMGVNGRALRLPMGKILGGGSSINAMAYVRGHKNDYDHWAREAGDEAWDYANVLKIFKRIEDWHGPDEPAYRGKGGLFYVQPAPDPNPIAPAMVESAVAAGIPAYADLNGRLMEAPGGCAIVNVTIKDGRRRSVFMNYLQPILDRPNITVVTNAVVQKLMLDRTTAAGVVVRVGGGTRTFAANREVVLSCGAINTPRILMLSGIGDEAMLKSAGVPVVHKLPGVGKNFRDHVLLAGCVWEYRKPLPPRNCIGECTLFWKSDAALDTPDLQPFQNEVPYASDTVARQFGLPQAGWSILPGLVRPASSGTVAIRSADPAAAPVIDAGFLSDSKDVKALAGCIELCREIGNGADMRPFIKREVMPGPLKGKDLETFVRDAATTFFHQSCTCRMGRDEGAVVDSKLRVRGIDRLRIADGSIMPRVTTGNTMMPCVIIGERMGQILTA
jgi:choline dehydrogenase-like flavoprotein